LPHDEGNKMTLGAWPRMRAQVVAIAIAGTVAGTVGSMDVHAHPQRRGASESQSPPRRYLPRMQRQHPASATSAPMMRTDTLLDFDRSQRDGHMTPEERHLLRQHIEEAVRELYKR
jgi:negative regulator of sigma E activity